MTAELLHSAPPQRDAGHTDEGLQAALTAWRLVLSAYLLRLRAAWAGSPPEGGDTDTARLLAGIDPPGTPDGQARQLFDAAVRAASSTGRLGTVATCLDLDQAATLTVAAAWWAEADPQFGVALGCCHDDGSRRYPTPALVRLLLGGFGLPAPAEYADGDPPVRLGALLPAPGPGAPVQLTSAARRYLAGSAPVEPVDGYATGPDQVVTALGRAVDGGGVVLVRGPGARAAALGAVRSVGRVPVERATAAEYRFLVRVCDVVPVVSAEELVGLDWRPEDGGLLAYGAPRQSVAGAYPVDLPVPAVAARLASWRAGLERYGLPSGAAQALAARFGFDDAEVADTVRRALVHARIEGRPPAVADVWYAARHRPGQELTRVATAIRPVFQLDDLVLRPDTRAELDELVSHVSLAHQVLEDWGFRARLPRGQGVVALLYGPPGTGKTMAAEAVANALGQDLYRVDLSAVISKYIGETEKNLALAFDEAERAGAVLLFDECDSLFGRRTEQRDAHDRWANLEVNYLLQRVETFTGLAILATNKRTALDEAFLRRLRFAIRFDPPDPALREQLWRRVFPPRVPQAGLDPAALAGAELAGGHIVQAALAAAFLAAAAGEPVGPDHVARAMRREYEKLGKSWVGGHG
ncbi:MAG TPA: AAA family ATPase [Natronosporangium sp.]